MKKIILGLLILAVVLTTPLNATTDPYPDWDWNGIQWIYVGSGNPPLPPPPPSRD